ncbi:MAG: DUF5916 domain-containing protein [Ferruginibacter sp.]
MTPLAEHPIIIARRDLKRVTSVINAQYNFTKRMNWTVRLRHYWSQLNNTNFYNLKSDGYWDERVFIPGQNINYNTFNIDMFYTWDFLLWQPHYHCMEKCTGQQC